MKRIFRPLYLSLAFAFALASCGTQQMVSTPVENIDNLPLKTTVSSARAWKLPRYKMA